MDRPARPRAQPGAGGGSRDPYGDPYGDPGAGRDPYTERDPRAGRAAPHAGRRVAAPPGPTRPDLPETGEPGPRRSSIRRGVTAVAAVLAAVVLVLATSGWAVLRHYDGRVRHTPLTFSAGVDRPASAAGGTQNILLVGSDTRAGTNGEFGVAEGQRSDTTILAHLDGNGSTTLISFPRDLWVRIPAYTDARGTQHAAQRSKLNSAFSYGGPSLLVATIEGLTGIRVDHYVQIDFVGFQGMTDALGGVTVCIRELPAELKARGFDNLHDHYSGFSGQVGENRLTGAQALAFVRQRYGLPESDIDRIRRQQQFLGVVFQRIASTDTLLNPAKLINVVDAATSAITLDDGTSLADLRLLAVRMQSVGSGGVAFATVPAAAGQRAGQSVLVPDPDQLGAFLKPFGGRAATASPAGALPAGPATTRAVAVSWSRPAAVAAGDGAPAGAQPTAAAAPAGVSCTY
ncbi:putative LytR family Transcriptional regulator [Frankia alni ACN14a]|uniref:LytR family Transcriptional regulator n=1 Tax=Frankia alni (strain DSM 45986 / CECT 9034 / ACN14a) TaxID=326424 RepID=Q0RDZ7_FRAAA|nr:MULTISPECIES: LCP family protein [Frankia]CAJ64319.1 putative LytR family Transcriptional regulator [Frankia alni ACN14a]